MHRRDFFVFVVSPLASRFLSAFPPQNEREHQEYSGTLEDTLVPEFSFFWTTELSSSASVRADLAVPIPKKRQCVRWRVTAFDRQRPDPRCPGRESQPRSVLVRGSGSRWTLRLFRRVQIPAGARAPQGHRRCGASDTYGHWTLQIFSNPGTAVSQRQSTRRTSQRWKKDTFLQLLGVHHGHYKCRGNAGSDLVRIQPTD